VTINGVANMLQRDMEENNAEKVRANLQMIEDTTIKMNELLSDTLKISSIGRIINPPVDVPFGELVQDALEQTEGEIKQNNIEVSVAEDFPTVHVDRMRIVEILVNLISNSIKFMGDQPQPKIEIGHHLDTGETVFFVRDNGIGIAPDQHEKVFEIFYKIDKKSEGTGAGLAIVKQIIEVHGGRTWIESDGTKGKGCTICFTLPGKIVR
jgi:signal transduction histidine kinase